MRLSRVLRTLFFAAIVMCQARLGLAQTTSNPNLVQFDPSPDHAKVASDGTPIVSEYLLNIFVVGQSVPVRTISIGKPDSEADGKIRVDFISLMAPFATPGVTYEARVVAAGPSGSTPSTVSNQFQYQGCSTILNPSSFSVAAAGSAQTLSVTAEAGCAWTAASTVGWLNIAGATSGTGPATIAFTVAPSDTLSVRTGTLKVNGWALSVTQAAASCSYTMSPPSAMLIGTGGAGQVSVTSPAGCPWTASSSMPWLTVTGGASGNGNGMVSFSAGPNVTGAVRSATVTVGGRSLVVTQDPVVCTYAITPLTLPVLADILVSGAGTFAWAQSSTDRPALQRAGTDRLKAAWYGDAFAIDITVAPGKSQEVAIYVADYDDNGRSEQIDLLDGTTVLDSKTVAGFGGGRYLVWNVTGHVVIRVTKKTGANAVVSGILLGPSSPSGASGATAAFVKTDDTTQGDWKGVYGANGYAIAMDVTTHWLAGVGGPGVVSVSSPAGCTWTAASSASWLTVTSGASGTSDGTVSFSVAANTTGAVRAATLTVGGQTLAVSQLAQGAPACPVTIAPTSQAVAAGGGTGSVAITAAGTCSWTANSDAAWLTITAGSSGTGNGAVAFSVLPNSTAAARTATVNIAGQTLTVSQAASACSYTLSSSSLALVGGAGPASVTVAAASGCAWTASSPVSWLTITSGSSGSGAGTVAMTASANPAPTPRTASLTIAGQTVVVTQAGAACVLTLSAGSQTVSDQGGPGTVAVTTGAGCAWTAASNAAWLTVTAGASGSGSGAVAFSAAANPNPDPRSATITIGGQSHTVSQPGTSCSVAIAPPSLPTPATVAITGANPWTYMVSTSDNRALERGTSGRVMAAWYAESFAIDVNVAAGRAQQVAVYAADYDGDGRVQRFDVVDQSGTLLDSRTLSNFGGGKYLLWTLTGHVTIRVVRTAGTNAVVSGVFVDQAPASSPRTGTAATFMKFDDSAFGDWKGVYGANAYTIASDASVQLLDPQGGAGSVAVSAGSTCAWTAVSDAPWVTATPASGTGSSTVALTLAPTTSTSERTATVTIGGRTLTLTQAAQTVAACDYTLSATNMSIAAAPVSGSIAVTTSGGCPWNAVSNAAWLTVTSGASGTGAGAVAATAAANTSPTARVGTLTIAGQTVTVTQAGLPCAYLVSTTAQSFTAAAGSGSVTVTAAGACAWTATSNAAWLTVTAGATGSGVAAVSYSVAANTGTAARTATLTIAGQTVTLTQAGVPCTYTISATAQSFTAAAATSSVNVTAPAGCAWTATSGAAWLTITAGASGTGNGPVAYSAAANTSTTARSASLTIAGQTFTVSQAGVPCTYAISASSQSLSAAAATGAVTVTAPAGCAWTAASSGTWLTVTSGASGTGSGTVAFAAAANTTTTPRTATLTIGGQTFTLTQAGVPCTFTISAASQSFPAAAGTGSVTVTAPAGCAWTASSSATWLTVTTGASGKGSGPLTFGATANTVTASRTATLTIAGQTFTVTQAGLSCTFTISAASQSLPAAAATGSVAVNAPTGCAWTSSSSATWLTVTSGGTGTASGTLAFSLAANTTTSVRTGTLTIAGQTFTVTQAGAPCTYTISATTQSFTAAAGTGSLTVTAPAGCAWTTQSSAAWLTTTAGASGTGNGTVAFTVASTTETTSRTATLAIGGQTFTATQAAVAPCKVAVAPGSRSINSKKTTGTIAVSAGASCTWTATSSASWLTVTSVQVTLGSVAYDVAANNTGALRAANITIAGTTFTVTQSNTGTPASPTGLRIVDSGQ